MRCHQRGAIHGSASSRALTVDCVAAYGYMSWIIDLSKPKTSSTEKHLVFGWTSSLTWPTPSSLGPAQGGRWEQDCFFYLQHRLLWLQFISNPGNAESECCKTMSHLA